MTGFRYNDLEFVLQPANSGWDILRLRSGADPAVVGAGLFAGTTKAEAETKACALVASIYPAGVRIIGPDVSHPMRIGDLKIVGPDVGHPMFVHWEKDSVSFPKNV